MPINWRNLPWPLHAKERARREQYPVGCPAPATFSVPTGTVPRAGSMHCTIMVGHVVDCVQHTMGTLLCGVKASGIEFLMADLEMNVCAQVPVVVFRL